MRPLVALPVGRNDGNKDGTVSAKVSGDTKPFRFIDERFPGICKNRGERNRDLFGPLRYDFKLYQSSIYKRAGPQPKNLDSIKTMGSRKTAQVAAQLCESTPKLRCPALCKVGLAPPLITI